MSASGHLTNTKSPLCGAAADPIDIVVVSLPDSADNWVLVPRLLEYRKRVFVDTMDWELYHAEGIEADQYDTLDTVHVIAHRKGVVVGGARLKRTTVVIGAGTVNYTYMIRDACRGLLPGMPNTLCEEDPPVDRDVWELTRFAADPIPGLGEEILKVANAYLFGKGARDCLFLGSPAFLRMARQLGWTPVPLGKTAGNKDGRFIAFKCAVRLPDQASV